MNFQPITRTGLTGRQIIFGLFLCLFFFLPGIIYFICASRTTYVVESKLPSEPIWHTFAGMYSLTVDPNNPRGRQTNPYKEAP